MTTMDDALDFIETVGQQSFPALAVLVPVIAIPAFLLNPHGYIWLLIGDLLGGVSNVYSGLGKAWDVLKVRARWMEGFFVLFLYLFFLVALDH